MSRSDELSHDYSLMQKVGELVAFTQKNNPDLSELCKYAVTHTFDFLEPISLFGASLETDGTIRPTGQYGFADEVMHSWRMVSIDEDLPTSDALKTNNIVWLADKAQWIRDYPHLAHYENDFTTNTFIAWPITVQNAYMSVLGLCAKKVEAPTPTLVSFFEIVGGIFALQISKQAAAINLSESSEISARINLFTRRQRYVMRLLVDGLTNQEIGRELGFSESTIRHETMRIYEIMGASGRADAIKKYRSLNLEK